MERAAICCTDRILQLHCSGAFGDPKDPIYAVFAGMGNNGGDGLAIARLLFEAGMKVRVFRVLHSEKASPDHLENLKLLEKVKVVDVDLGSPPIEIAENEVVIDALLGIGAARPLTGILERVVKAINSSKKQVVAIDMPTGLDATGEVPKDADLVVRAQWTLTIGAPKMALFLADNAPFIGQWHLVPIELYLRPDHEVSKQFVIEASDVVAMLKPKPHFAHKGTFGHAFLIAGSKGKMGAAVLATRAALRSGVGLVTAHVPAEGLAIVQSVAPEAMCSVDPSSNMITELPKILDFTSIGIGPGLGSDPDTKLMLKRLIQDAGLPMVLDADALNFLSKEPTWMAFIPHNSILTPHPKELDRLLRTRPRSSRERLDLAREFALRNGCVLVLKGAWTAICSPSGMVYFNPTGNPGMAKGGSGDALTGLLTGLLAQGYAPETAAIVGVFLHGKAGDMAAEAIGMDGMTAMDIVDAIPTAWQALRG